MSCKIRYELGGYTNPSVCTLIRRADEKPSDDRPVLGKDRVRGAAGGHVVALGEREKARRGAGGWRMRLRDYESRSVKIVPGLLTAKRRVVLVSPTGSGKTVVAAHVMLEMRGKRVLWLAHRWELIDQAREQLIAAGVPEESIRVFSGTEKSGEDDAWITVASIDMFRTHPVPPCDLTSYPLPEGELRP